MSKEKVKIEGVMLKCDRCGEYYEADEGPTVIPGDLTGTEVEEQALEDGWMKVGDKHYCSECAKIKRLAATKVVKFPDL